MSTRIGIDLGGTKTEGVVIDAQGTILTRIRKPTPGAEGYTAILNNIRELIDELETYAQPGASIGIGTPGALSTATGLLKNSNTVCMNGKPVKSDLETLLKRPVRMANDANCFALSEAIDGAGKNHRLVFGVIMGTGVGGGIVFNKELHVGPQAIAGEWGHNVLDAEGAPCYCGRRGCVETCLSGPGLLREYQQRGGSGDIDIQTLVTRAESGDALADETMQKYLNNFGKALSIVVNILDPDVIVLGGGMSNIERLYSEGTRALADYVFNEELLTPVIQNAHGDSAGVLGAARLWP